MHEPNQDIHSFGIIPKKSIVVLSFNIAADPKLYRALAPNPYSSKAIEIISQRFADASTADIIKALILVEPEGRYDSFFRQLPKALQKRESYKQSNKTSEIIKRLHKYYRQHAHESWKLSEHLIYEILFKTAFETTNRQEVEHRYTRDQRKRVKLLIFNFIRVFKIVYMPPLFGNKSVPKRQFTGVKPRKTLPRIFLAGLSLMLIFYLANGLYEKQDEQIIPRALKYPQVSRQILGIEAKKESPGAPIRLMIPAINVNAAIEYVGLTPEGTMGVPSNTVDVGWFDVGPRPGDRGSAVITGHFNGQNNKKGVFTDLHKLKEGDVLYIQDDRGASIAFVVRTQRTYKPGYADDVFSRNDSSHLNLVTCDGVWDKDQKSYTKRLVVFADIMN